MNRISAGMLPALLGLGFAGCAATPAEPLPELAGSHWQLILADRGALAAGAAQSGVTLAFEQGRIAGYGGCNRYSAPYTLEGGVLTPGPLVSTKRACMGDAGPIETQWYGLLAAPLSLSMQQGELVMVAKDGSTLRFAAAPVESPER